MSFSKFVDFLCAGELYFRRGDLFADRFEGALTRSIRCALDSVSSGEPAATENADLFYKKSRQGTYVCCWTSGAKENMALWQLFGGVKESVAICTTANRLIGQCLTWPEALAVRMQHIRYIDHFNDPDMIIGLYSDTLGFKHVAFDYEREVRILISRHDSWQSNPPGIRMPIANINKLVTRIIVAPYAESWFFNAVAETARRYGLLAPVQMSKLGTLPG